MSQQTNEGPKGKRRAKKERKTRTLVAWLPTYADAKFEWTTDRVFKSPGELRKAFLEHAEYTGAGLCHCCTEDFEIDDPGNLQEGDWKKHFTLTVDGRRVDG